MSRFGNDSGFLGVAHAPFSPSGPGKSDMVLNGVTLDRLADRKALLQSLDTFRRDVDNSHMIEGMDAFDRQAMDVLTSAKLVNALDISKESQSVRDRYGVGKGKQRTGVRPTHSCSPEDSSKSARDASRSPSADGIRMAKTSPISRNSCRSSTRDWLH